MAFQDALTVNSIREEYEHISLQKCECGGIYERVQQALLFDDEKVPFDRIEVRCQKCGKTAEFWFNVSTFFGKPFWEK